MQDERWDRFRRPGGRPWAADLAPDGTRSFADWVERLLMQLVILGLLALVLVQTLWATPAMRKWAVLADRLEGVNWDDLRPHRAPTPDAVNPAQGTAEAAVPVTGLPAEGELTLMLVSRRSAPGVHLLVDGRPAGDFRAATVTVRVRHGQRISVDGRAVRTPLIFRVVATGGLRAPPLGAQVVTDGDQQSLGDARAP